MKGYSFAGPVFIFVAALFVIAGALALYALVDASRRGRERFALLGESRALYSAVSVAYLVLVAVALVRPLGRFVAAPLLLATPVMLGFGVAYLLRVAFPSPERLALLAPAQDAAAAVGGKAPTDSDGDAVE